jgi:hypothetical protein
MGIYRTLLQTLGMAAFDAVDGSSTGRCVPRMWVLLKLPRFGGANHANGHNDRP